MASEYGIDIGMDDATVNKLRNGGFRLYAFKGVQTTIPAASGAPLVWFQSQKFSKTTTIGWANQYEGYTSDSEIFGGNGRIEAGASYPMNLGEILNIENAAGTGTIVTGGAKNALSLHNGTDTEFPSSGMSQKDDATGKTNPLCAFPLYGNNLNVFAPIEIVLLSFATAVLDTGTVLFQSFAPAALFNLTTENTLSVTYDINKGWITNNNPYIKTYPAGTNLAPLLLVQSSALSKRVLASQSVAPAPQFSEKANGGTVLVARDLA